MKSVEAADLSAASGGQAQNIGKQAELDRGLPRTDDWRFDFGPGAAAEGYRAVGPDCRYDADKGYGFEDGGSVYGRDRRLQEDGAMSGDMAGTNIPGTNIPGGDTGLSRLRGSFCIPLGAVFRVDLPDGTYRVTLLTGDELADTHTLVKAGGSKRILPPVRTAAGQFVEHRFAVQVYGSTLRLAFAGKAPRVNALEIVSSPNTLTLFLAGDSTVTDQPASGYPYAGWGQMLPALFKHDVCVDNHAVSGRSSRSFIEEGRLDVLMSRMKAGDFLLIQFGHNDEKADPRRSTDPHTTYKEYLRRYIDAALAVKAQPVLITPVQRRYFDAEGRLADTHGEYVPAVCELAAECGVPLIDLAEKTRALLEQAGPEGSKELFMWTLPGEYMNFPAGMEDNTHFQETGAARIAGLVAEAVRELQLQPLLMYLR
ncbi:rhamnogalacturonan acetylesterase [Paenibacillus sp. P96]|uniref:Rhamnogalacturonan acetylesterase n=1 Tax=Paenibacillus zeirhizosphaerae TaxID=2987519 RepID=A0ABT9FUC4_9BACL|nr:rhamnogalacturonan acetylesterase [Paenibacillus sp. P96]MDP4098308.1 rhamnogalacturonan acetylesterase [Paenibacillus sp. P96]